MTLDKKDFKMNMSRDKFNMLATFTGDKYLFCQSSLAQTVLIDRLRSNFCGAYHERINITSVQAYIVNQVNLFWPLIGEGVKPNTLSRLASIFLLNKIIVVTLATINIINTITIDKIIVILFLFLSIYPPFMLLYFYFASLTNFKTLILLSAPTALFNSFPFSITNNVGIDEILYFLAKSSF